MKKILIKAMPALFFTLVASYNASAMSAALNNSNSQKNNVDMYNLRDALIGMIEADDNTGVFSLLGWKADFKKLKKATLDCVKSDNDPNNSLNSAEIIGKLELVNSKISEKDENNMLEECMATINGVKRHLYDLYVGTKDKKYLVLLYIWDSIDGKSNPDTFVSTCEQLYLRGAYVSYTVDSSGFFKYRIQIK